MAYTHLTIEEREVIQQGLWNKESIRSIAATLGRSHSSIVREINKNLPAERRQYTPRVANVRALEKRSCRGRTDRLKTDTIRTYVTTNLKRRRSPEQISGCITADIGETISPEAIYQFIYAQIFQNRPRSGKRDFRQYLRHRRKIRQPHGARRYQRLFKPQGPSIDERPLIVNTRERIGDWESDTVESVNHAPGINTLVERKTGFVFITRLQNKSGSATRTAITNRLQHLPATLKRTITFDNGPENRDWQPLEKSLGIQCYFAHPYHSWERGTNENTNGLIRDYFPK
jgi:IS30 family transposase